MTARQLAIFLGPYRNLSTLTAAVLAMHPQIQVLNHGAERFWKDGDRLDFLAHPDAATFGRFMDEGWALSGGGQQGVLGGSILFSHAFEDEKMQALYRARYGETMHKPDASWMVWKESMRVQHRLMRAPGLFEQLCSAFPDLRFILPLRNALDCAVSNQRTQHAATMGIGPGAGLDVVLDGVLSAFAWGLEQRDRHPDRVFAFTQAEAPREVFTRLAAFLGVEPEPRWLEDVDAGFVVRTSYRYDPALLAPSRKRTLDRLGRWPEIAEAVSYPLPAK